MLRAGGTATEIIFTPGHTPGGITLRTGAHALTGDTLFPGGPGLTGWPLSDFDTIIESIRDHLFALPDDTIIHPGDGATTTIARATPPRYMDRSGLVTRTTTGRLRRRIDASTPASTSVSDA